MDTLSWENIHKRVFNHCCPVNLTACNMLLALYNSLKSSYDGGLFLLILCCLMPSMQTVSKEQSQDETEPQASPPARLQMTDSPAVPSLPPRQGMWKNLSELSDRAAAYQNKEVGGTCRKDPQPISPPLQMLLKNQTDERLCTLSS